DQKPIISNKKPVQQDNSLSTKKVIEKTPQISTNEISLRTPEKFLLNNPSQKSDQLKTNQPLEITAKKEAIFLTKIKHLKERLKKTTTERDNLKQLVQQEKELSAKQKQRADNYQQQLKTIAK